MNFVYPYSTIAFMDMKKKGVSSMNQVDVEKQEEQVNLADFIPSNCKG